METGSWELLGIAPTGDRGAIRRAYAGRLKAIDSGADPDGFRSLRVAYEAALQGAAWIEEGGGGALARVVLEPDVEIDRPVEPAVRPATPMVPQPLVVTKAHREAPSRGSAENIRQLIRDGRPLEAAAAWASSTELSFRDTKALSEELAARAIDPEMDLSTLDRLIEAMNWREAAADRRGSPALVAVMQRQLAERWFSGLVATAAMHAWWPGLWCSRVVAARLVMRPAPGWFERLTPWTWSTSGLAYWMQGVRRHRRWVAPHLDAARVAWCETAVTPNQSVMVRGLLRAVRFYLLWNLVVLGIGALRQLLTAAR